MGAVSAPLTDEQKILQALNRFTYGARPGDLERVRAMGLKAWLTQQLTPARIDDSALDKRLASFPALRLPLDRIREDYPDVGEIKAAMRASLAAGHIFGSPEFQRR